MIPSEDKETLGVHERISGPVKAYGEKGGEFYQ